MGRPRRYSYRRYTSTRARVIVGTTNYCPETEDDGDLLVVKISVDDLSFGLKLHEPEYNVLTMHIAGNNGMAY